jgi:protease-4
MFQRNLITCLVVATFVAGCGSGGGKGVAVVKVYGPIQTEPTESVWGIEEGGADALVRKIRRHRKDKNVKAIVLRVNSPGGSAAASQEILEELKKAQKDGKKVVVSMGDLAASGGYYIATHADKIYADPGTLTGSIGVYMGTLNAKKLAKKIGVQFEIIKSGPYKDIMSPWRDMTDEERDLIQAAVTDVYEQFIGEVAEGRGMTLEEVRPLADGRIYTGRQARKVGLVDELGGLQAAITSAADLAGIEGDPVIIQDPGGLWEGLLAAGDGPPRASGLLDALFGPPTTTDFLPVTLMMPQVGF